MHLNQYQVHYSQLWLLLCICCSLGELTCLLSASVSVQMNKPNAAIHDADAALQVCCIWTSFCTKIIERERERPKELYAQLLMLLLSLSCLNLR